MMITHIGNDYTEDVFRPERFQELVRRTARKVKRLQKTLNFNALVGCGHSGIPLTATVAHALRMPFFAVRKRNDSHGYNLIDGYAVNPCRYLIVDDFIESGATVRRIMRNMETEFANNEILPAPEPVGILLYADDEDSYTGPFKYRKLECPVFYI